MKNSVYVVSHGQLKRENNTICHVVKDQKSFLPVENTGDIYILGEVTLTRSFLALCGRRGISVHMFGYYGDYLGSFGPASVRKDGTTFIKQAQTYLDPHKRLELAKQFIRGSILNMLSVVQYYSRKRITVDEVISNMCCALSQVDTAMSINSLMAVEGRARNYYYKSFNRIIHGSGFEFKGRSRRPPEDPLNALISFLNCLCYCRVLSCIFHSHLDPRISFLHETNQRRNSLNLDVADVVKPFLVDRLILKLINKKMIHLSDFKERNKGTFLTRNKAKQVLRYWDEKLGSGPPGGSDGNERWSSYQEVIRKEIIKIEKHIQGESSYRPVLIRW